MQSNEINERIIEGSEIKVLQFEVDSPCNKVHHLVLNIQKVKEVVEFEKLQPLPENFHPFIGIYNLRDTPIPIIDLLEIFNEKTPDSTYDENDRIIICDFQKLLVGIIVSKTKRVLTLSNENVIPQPQAIGNAQKHLFNGIVQLDGTTSYMLDIEFILNSLNVDLGSKTDVEDTQIEFQGKTVLIAEDSRFFQKKIQRLFKKLGFITIMCEDGQAAYDKLIELNFAVDLLFTDIEMPKMNGIGLVRKIKGIKEAQSLPVLFNTSLSNPTLRDDIENNNLGRLIVKFDEQSILKELCLIFPPAQP
ncbi:MAG: chemotaxis protein CheV [Bacteriovoracaceae bacterium]|nr:chemotaxis protein CheV [Bacteriovoracaceae bacterium]